MSHHLTRRTVSKWLAAGFGFATGLPVGGAGAQSSSELPSVEAVPVHRFLGSMGIGIHHAQRVSLGTYFEPLRYLGVKNVRDDFGPASSYITLFRNLGIRAVLIAQGRALDESLAEYRRMAEEGALLAIEGPNEPNNFPITYEGNKGGGFSRIPGVADWTPVARYQRDLYARVKADPILKSYPVFNVSETGAQSPNVGLQFLQIPAGAKATMPDGTRYADYLNVHNYVSSTQKRYVDNQAWKAADPLLNDAWDGIWVNHAVTWGNRYQGYQPEDLRAVPRVTTETGWDSVDGIGGERVQGVVLLNTYLAQFKQGYGHTFVYMLRDGEGGAGHQGVFNKDSSPKLAATYIHNLTTLLRDNGTAVKPGRLAYRLVDAPDTVHDLLLQNSGGELILIVWSEKVGGTTSVEVVTDRLQGSASIYDPTVGTEPVGQVGSLARFRLDLTDHCLLIKITA